MIDVYEWSLDGAAPERGTRDRLGGVPYRTEPRRHRLGSELLRALDAEPLGGGVVSDAAGTLSWRHVGAVCEDVAIVAGYISPPAQPAPESRGRIYARPGAVAAQDAAVAAHGGMVTGTWRDDD